MKLRRKRTWRRQQWLQRLSDGDAAKCSGNVVGSQCAKLGLTEWSAVEDRHVLTLLGHYTLKNWREGGQYVPKVVPNGWQP